MLIRPLELELGWDWPHTVEGQGAAEQADALCDRNPRAILEERDLELVEPVTVRLSLGSRLRRLFDPDEP